MPSHQLLTVEWNVDFGVLCGHSVLYFWTAWSSETVCTLHHVIQHQLVLQSGKQMNPQMTRNSTVAYKPRDAFVQMQ